MVVIVGSRFTALLWADLLPSDTAQQPIQFDDLRTSRLTERGRGGAGVPVPLLVNDPGD